jgi:hypothetical protein
MTVFIYNIMALSDGYQNLDPGQSIHRFQV